ncbi:aminopeptidase N [Phreatobacter oligotrophus]|uniref:Aminopeptidase N n=3 Tax=Pseudomonadota TaxID=1224 RepID=A0A2T4ZFD3_9HYPH|nr:aminopeptidase N [Phreatobacter oligotrophus]PTM60632.1 aminopeptidase N [Phreatobacter oligotrophus]
MRSDQATPVKLSDYRVPDHVVTQVHLDVVLHPTATRIRATSEVAPHRQGRAGAPLVFDGDGLMLASIAIDGVALATDAYAATPDRLTIHQPPRGPFRLTVETVIDPQANTQLMGLYRSSGTWCTQCEAEGFRRITYFPDRPDVLAVYTTRIEAEKKAAPVLLGNGNLVEAGDLPDGRHYAVWHDPHPKPSYLFALVGGDLAVVTDSFTTRSGREVALGIYVEHGKEDRCAYAMDALKRSMRWDEEAFGCEYDLDVFNIVAVSDFNMGAMENKGLNIFNDKYVLALPDTATDQDYAAIEAIIAHEYFHNWTGNRITCRDWFQLCLKEGLTVFRDQEFSSDMRSRAVKRIADVRLLKSHQFAEDAGPLAHPVRPEIYHEINNFYTATVYEKGAEVIRALKVLIGETAFRAGMDLYLARHDGDAATVEDFIACFAEAGGRDLSQFFLWYRQSGTPEVSVATRHDAVAGTFTVTLSQRHRPTPGQTDKQPMVIPLAFGLVGEDGRDRPLLDEDGRQVAAVITLDEPQKTVTFSGHPTRPVLSINRGFSAPVALKTDLTAADLAFLAGHDGDAYNRWQAIQSLATEHLVGASRGNTRPGGADAIAAALAHVIDGAAADPAFAAQALTLPSEADIAREMGAEVDPAAVFAARKTLKLHLSASLGDRLAALRERFATPGPYSPDAASAGRRALVNVALDLWAASGDDARLAVVEARFAGADNMTDRFAALAVLAQHPGARREAALAAFRERYRTDALILDKWLALQAAIPEDGTLARVEALLADPAFAMGNPNRLRALVGGFATGNATQFNRPDGAGYAFLARVVTDTDPRNPQVAARLLQAFRSWRALEGGRRSLARAALERVAGVAGLSPDVRDIVDRMLSEPGK